MSSQQVKQLLKENNLLWDDFIEWMFGQTVAIINGEPDYYEYDVMRFIKYGGKKASAYEWD